MTQSKEMIYLASQSPRRREILKEMGIRFKVVRSRYAERKRKSCDPEDLVAIHARGKASKAVVPAKARFVLGADTIVCYRHHVLGKPRSWKDAFRMMQILSGRVHSVYTGLALYDGRAKKFLEGVSRTKVYFKKLSQQGIEEYLRSIHPYDKAGSYAIQEGPRVVRKINGSYSNVVGLPVELLKRMLRQMKRGRESA